MVGQTANLLGIGFKADLWTAKNNLDIWPQGFEQLHDLRCFHHIPDVHAQPDDPGLQGQQLFHDLQWPLRNHKLAQLCLRLQARAAMQIHVGQEVAQTQSCVNVFGIQGGKDN